MALIRIKHKHLADGVLIDQREFDANVHTPFEAPEKGAKKSATEGGDDKAEKPEKGAKK